MHILSQKIIKKFHFILIIILIAINLVNYDNSIGYIKIYKIYIQLFLNLD